MTDAPSKPEAAMQREELHRAFSKADTALAAGTITQQQRDGFLTHLYGSADEGLALAMLRARLGRPARTVEDRAHDPRVLVAGFIVLMVSLMSLLLWMGGGLTGAVIAETSMGINRTFTDSDTLRVILDNTDAVTLVGDARGEGDITVTLILDGTPHEMFAYRHAPAHTAHGSLAKSQYTSDEPVSLSASSDVIASLIAPDGNESVIDATQPLALPEGSYAFALRGNEAGVAFEERLPFTVVGPGAPEPRAAIHTCGQACVLDRATGTATLRVEISGDATLAITDVIISKLQNTPPAQIARIPDREGTIVTLDLASYFADEDGDHLMYETSHPPGAHEQINGSVVTFSGAPGAYTYLAYASDLVELVQSEPFTITILPGEDMPAPPAPQETTPNATGPNATGETTGPAPEPPAENTTNDATVPPEATNLTGTAVIVDSNATNLTDAGCDASDPNLRPVSCLNVDGATYFEEDVFLETLAREQRGRVTAIGNLLLKGGIDERSAAAPADGDYTIGYKDDDFHYIPTVWIDAAGNLHLRGALHEENANLVPPPGSFSIINRRGVYMLWADPRAGDLYLRGNAIPYRRSIYE